MRYPWHLLHEVEPEEEMPSASLEPNQAGGAEADGTQPHTLRAPRGRAFREPEESELNESGEEGTERGQTDSISYDPTLGDKLL